MNWVDEIVLLVLAASALLALLRGFVREVLGLAAWVLGVAAAAFFYHPLVAPIASFTHYPEIAPAAAIGIVFVITLILLSLVGSWIGGLVRLSPLSGIDRLLGFGFGLARGAALLVFAYIVGNMTVPLDHWPAAVIDSRSLPYVYAGARWILVRIPDAYRPHLDAPPSSGNSAPANAAPLAPGAGGNAAAGKPP